MGLAGRCPPSLRGGTHTRNFFEMTGGLTTLVVVVKASTNGTLRLYVLVVWVQMSDFHGKVGFLRIAPPVFGQKSGRCDFCKSLQFRHPKQA